MGEYEFWNNVIAQLNVSIKKMEDSVKVNKLFIASLTIERDKHEKPKEAEHTVS